MLNEIVVERPIADKNIILIHIFTGENSNGLVYEELPSIVLADGNFKLLKSPGLALNLAKDDVINLKNENFPPEVISRGGNFCIQIYYDNEINSEVLKEFSEFIEKELDASLDGKYNGSLSFSVPAKNGFKKINDIFDQFRDETGLQWYYCNIYKNINDPDDETLLDWWAKFEG